jgi:hypothetical protein
VSQVAAVVERQHQTEEEHSWKRKTENTEFGGSHPGEGRVPEVDGAIQQANAV